MNIQDVTSIRRARLRHLIETRFNNRQADFIAATEINQGELSALLKNKSFGEKKARNIERIVGLPAKWLDEGAPNPDTIRRPPRDMRETCLLKHFAFLTDEQKDSELKRIKALADANRVIVRQLKGRLNPPTDEHVGNHLSRTPKTQK